MPKKYVCNGAKLKCSMGSKESPLGVTHPIAPVSTHKKNAANITDHKPMMNIKPFGMCKSILNPTVAAATAAASGKLQEMPCIPVTPAPWLKGKMNAAIKGLPALLNDCTLMCTWAGQIKVSDAGQKTVLCGAKGAGAEPSSKSSTPKSKSDKSKNTAPTDIPQSDIVTPPDITPTLDVPDVKPPAGLSEQALQMIGAGAIGALGLAAIGAAIAVGAANTKRQNGADGQDNEKAEEEKKPAPCSFCRSSEFVDSGCACEYMGKAQGHPITDKHYDEAAEKLGVEKAILRAIGKKESRGSGFHTSGHAVILFERKKMYGHLQAKNYTETQLNELIKTYPSIVYRKTGDYNVSSYEKLKTAKEIDYDCAVMSCSWGCFQVMGEYYQWLYASPAELEQAMCACELQQFVFFAAYLEKSSAQMIPALKNKKWRQIASLYNGSAWETQNPTYASDLEKYYKAFKASGV